MHMSIIFVMIMVNTMVDIVANVVVDF